MKINLVSEATYYPARVGQKSNADASPSAKHKVQSREIGKFEKLLLEKLSHDETAAINKLFGEFRINSAGEPKDGNSSPGDVAGSMSRGKFIDITI